MLVSGVQVQIEHEHTASSADAATRVDASLARALSLCLKTSHIEPGQSVGELDPRE